MTRPAKTEETHPEELDLYNLHNLTSKEREKLHLALRPDKNGHSSPSCSPEPMFVCPSCKHEIKFTESISAPVVERLRKQFEAEARKKDGDCVR